MLRLARGDDLGLNAQAFGVRDANEMEEVDVHYLGRTKIIVRSLQNLRRVDFKQSLFQLIIDPNIPKVHFAHL